MKAMADRQYLEQLVKKLADDGKLIESGWVGLRLVAPDVPPERVREMRMAFMAGALHLFGSLNSVITEKREPTEADIARLRLMDDELRTIDQELKLQLGRHVAH